MFRLILTGLPFEVAAVSRETFDSKEEAEQFLAEHYAKFPALEVIRDDEIDYKRTRVVPFPERPRKAR